MQSISNRYFTLFPSNVGAVWAAHLNLGFILVVRLPHMATILNICLNNRKVAS